MTPNLRSRGAWARAARALALPLGVLLAATSCSREANGRRAFRLEGLQTSDLTAVALNEELCLSFTDRVDPTSVTADSLSVVGATGEAARGEWSVEGQLVRFRPSPVLAADLSDGGFRPGIEYEVRVNGFPRLNGLRSVAGTPLDRCTRIRLRTAEMDGPDVLLEDYSPGECGTVWFPQQDGLRGPLRLGALEPIRIYCREPLDPRSLRDEDFWIEATRVLEAGGWEVDAETGQKRWVQVRDAPRRIAVRAALRENLHELPSSLLDPRAQIELQPVEALAPSWTYELRLAPFPGPSLVDFRGNRARRWGRDRERVIPIEVVDHVRERPGQLALQFLDRKGFLPLDLPWVDGTAHWSDSGRLTVRFPAAAGDGSHGAVELRGDEGRVDVRATELTLPAGERVRLPPGGGLRILRAQGRLTLDGTLERTETNGAEPPLEPFAKGGNLSDWIEETRRENRDWTVLIAGGDLTIRGRVEVDTPLLLVAGGWIRVSGQVVQPPDQLWLMPDGGGTTDATASDPGLVLDAPSRNPLVEPLTVAAITFPVPSRVGEYRWIDLEVGGRAGAGSYRVRFLPPDGPVDPARAVDHPGLVDDRGQVRLLLELTVPPGEIWDPPSIDHVILDWDPTAEGG